MGRVRLVLLIAVLIGVVSALIVPVAMSREKEQTEKRLRHVVLFKFKPEVDQQQIQQVVREFAALEKKIDAIVDWEGGKDVSVEGFARGYTHCFVVTFVDEKGRDAYLPHPAHQAFVDLVKPKLESVLVIDYWSGEEQSSG